METYKKMERKLIDITFPRMEDQPKSLNAHGDKGPWTKLRFLSHSRTQENHSQ